MTSPTPAASTPPCLSLSSATLINLNLMLGSGIFANTILLGSILRGVSPFAYVLVGLLITPLIYAFQKLLSHFSEATFYDLGASVHPLVGFISGWSYFFAKLASCSFSIHVFVTLTQTMIPALSILPAQAIDLGILCLFMYLNLFNLRIGRNIQFAFIFLKAIPILFAIFSLLFTFSTRHFTAQNLPWSMLPSSVPFVLFAMTGFEASCSLSASIKDSQKNGPRAIRNSFIIVVCVLFLYQLSFFVAFGPSIASISGYQQAFPALIAHLHIPPLVALVCKAITLSGIAVSALGASYGIMYSNSWNIYGLARKGYTFCASWLTRQNPHGIPLGSMLLQGGFIAFYTIVFGNAQKLLQPMNACGITMAYTISAAVFVKLILTKRVARPLWGLLALGSCAVLMLTLVKNALSFSAVPLITFGALLAFGLGMFVIKRAGARARR